MRARRLPPQVVLGEPQHRGGDAHLPVFAFAEPGQDRLVLFGLAQAHQGVYQPGPHLNSVEPKYSSRPDAHIVKLCGREDM